MAEEHQIEARILLRYDTYSNWMNSSLILLPGEAAICSFPYKNSITNSDITPEKTPPAIGLKVGDGEHVFYELPWVQGVAADVYSWAKTAEKPEYVASEIIGLAEYIEAHNAGSGGGPGSGTGTIYRITYNTQSSKYILQVYNETEGYWEDTESEIDFSAVLKRLNSLERWANGYTTNIGDIELPLTAYIYDAFLTYITRLTVEDNAEPHQFVTAVSETNGKINVTRRELDASDITSGVLPTEYGGTGLSEVEDGKVLVGSRSGRISTKNYSDTIDINERDSFATTNAIINYVEKATAGLTGAMHFIGEATVNITDGSNLDPQIPEYKFQTARSGDVILGTNKEEYVWTGSNWRLLGDEGSYAVKGSITNVDIADNAEINIGKIADLSNLLNTKVDKVEGKTLTSNDFTNEYKQKLSDIENDAQRNLIEHIFLNEEELPIKTVKTLQKSINIELLPYTEAEQLKLAGIAEGAQVNTIQSISVNGTTVSPTTDKVVDIIIPDHAEHANKIEKIYLNSVEQVPDSDKNVNIVIDENAVTFNIITGARVPNGLQQGQYENVQVNNKQLELARIAATGRIYDIQNTTAADAADYLILNCGDARTLID